MNAKDESLTCEDYITDAEAALVSSGDRDFEMDERHLMAEQAIGSALLAIAAAIQEGGRND